MSVLDKIKFKDINVKNIQAWDGLICLIVPGIKKLPNYLDDIDTLMGGALKHSLQSESFKKLTNGQFLIMSVPLGLRARELRLVKFDRSKNIDDTRSVGGSLINSNLKSRVLILSEPISEINQILYGLFLKAYKFEYYKKKRFSFLEDLVVMNANYEIIKREFKFFVSLLRGIYLCKDLTNEPANILNTVEFAKRLSALAEHGLIVDILEEEDLKKLGMKALLAVGQGSTSPSKVVIIKWKGTKKNQKPLMLLGKGVVFDSGGISLKSSGGMDEMIMDMGGAAVVAGIMKTLAIRKSSAKVIGLIGIVENMPDGNSQRPGDVVRTMKGDTVEVLNTDAEGRLVLCDLMWYAQTKFSPKAIIDLATLTGAVIYALGSQKAGIFSNNDEICKNFLKAAKVEGEGAWRLPLDPNYRKLLKSRVADIANVGGRTAGAITAAQFLENFIANQLPWIHIDIAGVAFSKQASKFSTQGATGWGVASINRFIYDYMER